MTSSENGTEPQTESQSVDISGSIDLEAAESMVTELIRAVKQHGVTVTISIYPWGEADLETTQSTSA